MGHFVGITSSIHIHTNTDYSPIVEWYVIKGIFLSMGPITAEVAYLNQTKSASIQILLFAPYYLLYSIDPLWKLCRRRIFFNSFSLYTRFLINLYYVKLVSKPRGERELSTQSSELKIAPSARSLLHKNYLHKLQEQ